MFSLGEGGGVIVTPVLSLELYLCVFTGGGGFIVTPALSLELYLCVFTGGGGGGLL